MHATLVVPGAPVNETVHALWIALWITALETGPACGRPVDNPAGPVDGYGSSSRSEAGPGDSAVPVLWTTKTSASTGCGRSSGCPRRPRCCAENVGRRYYVGLMMKTTESLRVEVRRSRRRTRTISAYREKDAIVVLIPARLSAVEEQQWVTTMVERVTKAERRRRRSDDDLVRRAATLSRQYLDGSRGAGLGPLGRQPALPLGFLHPGRPDDPDLRASARRCRRTSSTMSCSTSSPTSWCMATATEFWAWVNRYPLTERARGFLDGVSATAQLGIDGENDLSDQDQQADQTEPGDEARRPTRPSRPIGGRPA